MGACISMLACVSVNMRASERACVYKQARALACLYARVRASASNQLPYSKNDFSSNFIPHPTPILYTLEATSRDEKVRETLKLSTNHDGLLRTLVTIRFERILSNIQQPIG